MVEEKQRRTREKALKTLQQESQMLKTTKEGCVVYLGLEFYLSILYLILIYSFHNHKGVVEVPIASTLLHSVCSFLCSLLRI